MVYDIVFIWIKAILKILCNHFRALRLAHLLKILASKRAFFTTKITNGGINWKKFSLQLRVILILYYQIFLYIVDKGKTLKLVSMN